ncbi:MAG: hypothetical protein AUG51_05385 [Acidobacteria bacterium 13_1_20CM_3_53_8]|nr:MAG: hypothetical protein AUG51_05385 [Acidobacteria bacterium 13_1_20CM_3_53_8]
MRPKINARRTGRAWLIAFTFFLFCSVTLLFSATPRSKAGGNVIGNKSMLVSLQQSGLPSEIDVRGSNGVPKGTALRSPTAAQVKAINSLQAVSGVTLRVEYNGLTATPRHLFSFDGYLTPPSSDSPETIARNFLKRWSAIFRFSDEDLRGLRLKSRATVPDMGTTILLFEQQASGLPVYHGEVLVNVNRSGQIIDVGSESFPQLSITNAQTITPAQAITAAASALNISNFTPQSLGTAQVLKTYGNLTPEYVAASKYSKGGVFTDDIVVTRTVFPLGDTARQAYKFVLTTPQYKGVMWEHIVDAQTGEVLRRFSLTSFFGDMGGGPSTNRRSTFRPDIQDRVEAMNPAGTAAGKVFDGMPTALSGTLGVGRSPAPGTPPTYPAESTTAQASGRGFRKSFVSARNQDPFADPATALVYNTPFGQVLRAFPDALNPSAESPFGWFYLPTTTAGTEVTTSDNNRATTRAIGYVMSSEAQTRNDAANSPTGNGSQPFSAALTTLLAPRTINGNTYNSVFESNYTEGNNVFTADDRENDDETTHGIKGFALNRQFTASRFDFINSYEYGGVDADGSTTPVTYPASSNPDVYPGDVTLFYYNNLIHDYLYSIGFTEQFWNFQQDNFDRGGAGRDAISAQVQDGSGTDNANFGTPADGGYPRMQMFLFTESTFRRSDGDFDWDVVAHEHYHGVSNRSAAKGDTGCLGVALVGEPGGMGEGWSDYNATSIADDDSEGEYVTGEFDVGIRRLPYTNYRYSYATANGVARTRRDTRTASDVGAGVPFEVHDVGELWAATLWDMRELLIMKQKVGATFPGIFFDGTRRLGSGTNFFIGYRQVQSVDTSHPIDYRASFNTNDPVTIIASQAIVRPGMLAAEIQSLGNRNGPLATAVSTAARLSDTLVLRGLQLSPCNPSFVDERDSILAADREMTGGENQAIIWRAFASHGVGMLAQSTSAQNPGSSSAPVVVEDFSVPAGVTTCEQSGPLQPPPFALSNTTNNVVTITINGGTAYPGAAQYVISRANSANGPFTTIATIPATQTTYNDDNGGAKLPLGQTFYYQVRASRDTSSLCVSTSDTQSITVTTGVILPIAPTFAGIGQVSDPGQCSRLVLSWSPAVSANPNANIVYDIYRVDMIDSVGNTGTQDPTFTPSVSNRIVNGFSGLSYSDTNLELNHVYYYIVQARDTNNGLVDTNNTGNTIAKFSAPTTPGKTNTPVFAQENFETTGADARFFPNLVESSSATPSAQADPVFQRRTGVVLDSGLPTTSTIYAPDFDPASNPVFGGGAPSDFSTEIGDGTGLTLTPTSIMEFDHKFSAESTFDGGVIEIKVGAPFSNTANGSDPTLTPYPNNTTSFDLGYYIIDGRRAYTGAKGLHHVRIPLRAFAPGGIHNPTGLPVHIRFRMTSDAGTTAGTDSGWYIDNLVINNLACAPTAASATISGRITTSDGAPLSGVALALNGAKSARTITDSNGFYRFENVGVGSFYTVTPSAANYTFGPADRSFSLNADKTDVTFTADAAAQTANPLDTGLYFVRQQYLDFLGREPDQGGLDYWSNEMDRCGDDAACVNSRRIGISAAFFIEQEFQQTGSSRQTGRRSSEDRIWIRGRQLLPTPLCDVQSFRENIGRPRLQALLLTRCCKR